MGISNHNIIYIHLPVFSIHVIIVVIKSTYNLLDIYSKYSDYQ